MVGFSWVVNPVSLGARTFTARALPMRLRPRGSAGRRVRLVRQRLALAGLAVLRMDGHADNCGSGGRRAKEYRKRAFHEWPLWVPVEPTFQYTPAYSQLPMSRNALSSLGAGSAGLSAARAAPAGAPWPWKPPGPGAPGRRTKQAPRRPGRSPSTRWRARCAPRLDRHAGEPQGRPVVPRGGLAGAQRRSSTASVRNFESPRICSSLFIPILPS